MVLSSLASFIFFDFTLTGHFLMGASIVLLATWVYNSEEGRLTRAPRISLAPDEKASLNGSAGLNDMSIQIPKTPLVQQETALATSRPGSPSHKKRNKEAIGYFAKHHG